MNKQMLSVVVCGALMLNACKKEETVQKPVGVAYNLNQGAKIEWKGKAADGNSNWGTINVEGQHNDDGFDFDILNKEIRGGVFKIPVSSISVTNLPAHLKPILEGHLKTADFFYAVLHPNVTFKIHSGKPESPNGSGTNYLIKGEMTLLGNTHPLDFPAQVTITDKTLTIKADFSFNQTIWGMNYKIDPSYPEADRMVAGIEVKFNLTAQVK
ncbi:YceI family protein [Pedobacter sp. B4-66]|uniref:YceI family protein n=1 Tax=Pedobacter sp. B4-66 TaxID=2817280 RepID=UPI001BD99DC2|nr:YceI family protein [Pedobacter sp. B4-66]